MNSTAVSKRFHGTWRITWMEQWDADAIDLDGEGRFIFEGDGGRFQFICVHGLMHSEFSVDDGHPHVEFMWDGSDESDPANGRGYASIIDGELRGRIYFFNGDGSDFRAKPKGKRASAPDVPPDEQTGVWPQLPDEATLLKYLALLRGVIVETRLAGYEGDAALAAELMDAVENVPDLLARFPDMDEDMIWEQVEETVKGRVYLSPERLRAIRDGLTDGILLPPSSGRS